jgi:[glutamine synthetase] adenylyltransferase / [glutamine synthetase]-adenylyl-L-tyrosine phosphorylase
MLQARTLHPSAQPSAGAAEVPAREALARELSASLRGARYDYQDLLDAVRGWVVERRREIARRWLERRLSGRQAAALLSALAEIAIDALLQPTVTRLAATHGRILAGRFAVLGLGKLGSAEMTAQSDLDLMFVYEVADDVEGSDGMTPLAPSDYYARLAQRLIAALSAPTLSGSLYDVDMRLRPFGESAPIASSLEALRRYYGRDAWTWEIMALTRARPVAGDGELAQRLRGEIGRILTRDRDANGLRRDVAEMRERVAREFAAPAPWDCKHRRGGLMDIEFVAQYAQLLHATAQPDLLARSTCTALKRLRRRGLLDHPTATTLIEAHAFWHEVQAGLRLLSETEDCDHAGPELFDAAVERATGLGEAAERTAFAEGVAASVRACYARVVGAA